MRALREHIAAIIGQEGPIGVARYMALALGHPALGYYHSRDPLGTAGDFTTAPEISQMFGELLGLWAADCWAHMGRPERFALVELGPGRGTLMADALRAGRVMPGFLAAADVHLVETSEVLRIKQRETLAASAWPSYSDGGARRPAIDWHASFRDVPAGPLILVANEFFDALPIRQFVRARGAWHERLVGLGEDGELVFGLSASIEPALRLPAPEGATLEICPEGIALAGEIGRRVVRFGGAALLIDYGHADPGFGDTLQAVRGHAYSDPLTAPGESDLTAHVDFSALSLAAHQAGAATHGPSTQGAFLRRLGIEDRAARLKTSATAAQGLAIDAALERLTSDRAMGTLFKAMGISDVRLGPAAGFE